MDMQRISMGLLALRGCSLEQLAEAEVVVAPVADLDLGEKE